MPTLIVLLALGASTPDALVVVRDCDDHAATSAAVARTVTELAATGTEVLAPEQTSGSLTCWIDERERARAAMKRGIVAFDNVDMNAARTAFREAHDVFVNAGALMDAGEMLAEILTYRAWLAVLAKNVGEARDLLVAADDVAPQAAMDGSRFPPQLITLRNDVRTQREQRKPRSVSVVTSPPGASLYVNGVRACNAPCTVTAPSRLAFVEAQAGRHAPVSAIVDGDTLTLTLQPDTRRELIARDPSAIASLPVPALLTLQPVARGATMHAVVTLRDGSRELDVPLTDPELVAARVTLLVANATNAITAAAPPPFYKRWWFWTAAGVVAAGAVTGIVVATHRDTSGPVIFDTGN